MRCTNQHDLHIHTPRGLVKAFTWLAEAFTWFVEAITRLAEAFLRSVGHGRCIKKVGATQWTRPRSHSFLCFLEGSLISALELSLWFKDFGRLHYIFSKHYLPASSAIEDLDATLLFFEDIFLEAGAGGASSTLTDLERGWGSGC